MRLLKQAGVAYDVKYYDLGDTAFSGEAVCAALGVSEAESFKTLCARGERKGVAVFVIPIADELNLKAAATALGDKAVTLAAVKELPTLTGYERGSVSPVGMKKKYPVFVDESALAQRTICVSGGMKGVTLAVDPRALAEYLGATFAPVGTAKTADR